MYDLFYMSINTGESLVKICLDRCVFIFLKKINLYSDGEAAQSSEIKPASV